MVPVSLPGLVQMLWMLQGVENTIQYEVTTPGFWFLITLMMPW